MNKFICITLILAIAGIAECGEYKKSGEVLILGDKTFEQARTEHPTMFVKFYAPWCPHCKAIAPKWKKLAKEFKANGSNVAFAKVNAEKNPNVANEHQIQGYPTLKLFHNGRVLEYNGHPSVKKLRNFINKKTGPLSTEITTDEQFNNLANEKLALAFFGDEEDYKIFEKVVGAHEDIKAFHSHNEKYYNLNNQVRVTLFKDFAGGKTDFLEPFSAEALEKWLLTNRYEPIMSIEDQATIERIFNHQTKAVLFFNDGEPDLEGEQAKPFVFSSQHHKGSAAFVTVNTKGETGQEIADYFGIDEGEKLTILGIVPVGEEDVDKYLYTGAWDKEDVKVWVQNFLDGKLEKHFRSEEIPTENKGAVKIVVGKNYEEVCHNPNAHVFIMFYAPWCHHCKKLKKPLNKLAKQLSYFGEEVIIAKIDGTKNEVPGIVVQGFPTLYYYPKGENQKPVHYQKGRSLKAIKKFLKKKLGDDWRDK